MKKYLIAIITVVLLLLTNVGFAQDKITEDLNNASIIFEEGRVKESLKLLKEIEKNENLTKAQKENLYRQMTICYIILNSDNLYAEMSKDDKDSTSSEIMAKESYLKLLRTNNIYEADSMDIIDYVRFTKKFISKPVIILNPRSGTNTSFVDVLQYYGTSNLNIADTAYYALSMRQPFGSVYANHISGVDVDWNIYHKFFLSVGGSYTHRSFRYNENLWYAEDKSIIDPTNSLFSISFVERQQWIDANIKLKYDLGKSKTFLPYIYGGFSYHTLLKADLKEIERSFAENLSVDNIKEIRFVNNYSIIGGGGFKWRVFGKHYFTMNMEYGRMMNSINDIDARYTSTVANALNYTLGYVDNDIRMNNIALTVGFAFAFYNPKMKKSDNDK